MTDPRRQSANSRNGWCLSSNTEIGSAGAALERTLDVVLRDGRVLGLLDRRGERRVPLRVSASAAGSGFDAFDEFGEQLAAFGVLTPLAVFDVGPFRVS
jgi:hypothetical protein